MKERMICFSLGLSDEDIEKGKISYYGLNQETQTLDVVVITKDMLTSTVGEVLDKIMAGPGPNDAEKSQRPENTLPPDLHQYRVVIVHTLEHQRVLQIMRSFKAVLPDPQNIIFAVVTDTARTWTFRDYIGHLAEEHEYRKTHKPGDDPEMKRM